MRPTIKMNSLITPNKRRGTIRSTIITVILTLLFAFLVVEGGFYDKYLVFYYDKYLGHSQVQESSFGPASQTQQGQQLIIGSVCQGIKSGIARRSKAHGIPVNNFYGYVMVPSPIHGKPDQMIKAFTKVVWCEYHHQLHKAIVTRIAHLRTTNAADVFTTYEVGSSSSNTQSLKSCAEGLEPFSDSLKSLTVVCTGVLYASQHGVYGLQIWLSDREALVRNGTNQLFLTMADVIALVGNRVNKNIGKHPAALLGVSTD